MAPAAPRVPGRSRAASASSEARRCHGGEPGHPLQPRGARVRPARRGRRHLHARRVRLRGRRGVNHPQHLRRPDRLQRRGGVGHGHAVSADVEGLPGLPADRQRDLPVELPERRHPRAVVLGVHGGLPAAPGDRAGRRAVRQGGAEPGLATAVGRGRSHAAADVHDRRWNAQESNFGTGGTAENDPLIGDAQAGAVTGGFPSYLGRDNANMISNPDGVPSITNMYLWQPIAGAFYAPCVDGDYDMAVIGNEYGFVPVSGENPFAVGAYVTGNKDRAIRNYGMNFPRTGAFPAPGVSLVKSGGPLAHPLNFSNMGYDITGPQVHADGEIWSATNFDIPRALVA